jgi:hypothetical protein
MKATKDIPKVKIKLTITPGQTTPAARRSWDLFWKRLIASVKNEVKAGER